MKAENINKIGDQQEEANLNSSNNTTHYPSRFATCARQIKKNATKRAMNVLVKEVTERIAKDS